MEIVDRMMNDPNSVLNEDDRAELETLSPECLQRLEVGMQTRTASNQAASSRESELRARLADVQNDILNSLTAEQEIRDELVKCGVSESSVIDQFVPVMNESEEITEKDVIWFIENSRSNTARILQEGIAARNEGRSKAIKIIVANCPTFTEAELQAKFTPELIKLANFIQERSKPQPVETKVFNWEGAALADQSISSSTSMNYGPPLELPTTFNKEMFNKETF